MGSKKIVKQKQKSRKNKKTLDSSSWIPKAVLIQLCFPNVVIQISEQIIHICTDIRYKLALIIFLFGKRIKEIIGSQQCCPQIVNKWR